MQDVLENDSNTNKRIKAAETPDNKASNTITFKKNHPLPNEDGPVCLVKVYDEEEEAYKVL